MLKFYYYYPAGILDKQLTAFINNVKIVEGLPKWIFASSFIAVIVTLWIICK